MTAVFDRPRSDRGAWRFRLFGVPVCVLPWFWIATLIMGASNDTGAVLIWIAVCFVSILVHELGHVMAFRSFGIPAEVALYAWGGLAIPTGARRPSSLADVVISLAGPFAGFGLAFLTMAIATLAGAEVHLRFHSLIIPSVTAFIRPDASNFADLRYWNILLSDLLWVNIGWGLVNLLPIHPLDGGHVSRALFEKHDPLRGKARSLLLSACVGAAIAVLGLINRSMFMVAMFGFLAAGSAQMWEEQRPLFRRGKNEGWRR